MFQVEITLLDKNDSPPVFSSRHIPVTVEESAKPGFVVIKLVATDADTEGAIQYQIKDGDDGKFTIDPATGRMTF